MREILHRHSISIAVKKGPYQDTSNVDKKLQKAFKNLYRKKVHFMTHDEFYPQKNLRQEFTRFPIATNQINGS